MSQTRWKHIGDIFAEEGMVPENYDISGFVYNAPSARNPTIVWIEENVVSIAIGFAAFIFALLGFFVIQLRHQVAKRTAEVVSNRNELQQQRDELQSLLDTINGVNWVYDPRADRFNYISPNLEEITGYRVDEWAGMSAWLNTIVEEDRDEALGYCTSESAAGRDHIFEYRMRKKNGEIIWVMDIVGVSMGKDGKPERMTGFIINISEQKTAEIALMDSQKMQALGQLTGGIAHDFNNILNIVLGNIELLELMEIESEEAICSRERCLVILRKTTDRAIKITQKLLGFSRSHANEAPASDINQVITDMMEMVQYSLKAEITVTYELEPSIWKIPVMPSLTISVAYLPMQGPINKAFLSFLS